MTLTEAYERQASQLPSLYRTLVKAGIASGDLPGVLDQISRHASERLHIATRLRRAMFYPLVSATSVILVSLVMLLFLGLGVGRAAGDGNLLVFSSSASPRQEYWWSFTPWLVLGLFTAVVLGVFITAWLRNPLDGGSGRLGLRFRLPFLGQLNGLAAKSGFATTMAMLLERGLPLPHSLRLAGAVAEDATVAGRIAEMSAVAEGGGSLAESVRAGGILSPAMMWFVEQGETSGVPARSLADVAEVYRQRLDRGVDRLCFVAAPLGILLTGLVVLWSALIYLWPLFASLQSTLSSM